MTKKTLSLKLKLLTVMLISMVCIGLNKVYDDKKHYKK